MKNKYDFVFARNPIVIDERFPAGADDPAGGRLSVMMDGSDILDARFSPPLNMDISEIVDANIDFFPEPPADNNKPIRLIEDLNDLYTRSISVTADYDGNMADTEAIVIPGGVSKQNYRQLYQLDKDAFTARFLNPACNFFLTTRNIVWRILMKETELYPLYFLSPDRQESIEIMAAGSSLSIREDRLEPGVYTLDVDALRRVFVELHDSLPNVFDVYKDGNFSCRIVVERAEAAKERYRLKFRNSLGVFEIIELTGELSVTPEYDDVEEAAFMQYDSITRDFHTERERVERRQSVTIETGIKRHDEIAFIMDMVSSEEVYLLDLTALPVKVIPSVEDFTYRARPESPEKFTLRLAISDSESNIMQDIVDGMESRKPRVFSKQFNNRFN